ncbi:DNA transfer protein [Serratia fonticola]|uniref:DNA transfer protein n=1 Tax=Serratia fonticola TaxID=47917 RepID=UPI001644D82F|nr:DNA transfer protein [Serratia fonticola]MBC3251216.1 DNA transfer protein [Serratia fonticola]
MGGIAKGIGKVVGSITGANQAAEAQTNAANASNENAWRIYQDQKQTLSPFLSAGQGAPQGLTGLAGQPIDRNALLSQYYKSPEYAQMANQARYQQLASAEATGGLGSTATSNGLAFIAPQLGQNYLSMKTDEQQNMFNQLMGLTNVGLSAGGASNAAGGQYASTYAQNMGQIGAAQAGNSLANGSALTQGLGFLAGSGAGQAFGTGVGNIVKSWF